MHFRQVILVLFILGVARNIVNRLDFSSAGNELEDLDVLLHKIQGAVGKENFTYYSLYEEGNIKIVLETIKGDADLYLSSNKKPEFHPNQYDYASTTCGLDVIEVPEELKRPLVIGVFGHTAYETSIFRLSMYVTLNDIPRQHERRAGSGGRKTISFKEKINFIIRNTAMWKTFELLEGIFFTL